MNFKLITSDTYNGLDILPTRFPGEEKRSDILDKIFEPMLYMLQRHNKVLQTRFDLHYPDINGFEYLNRDIYNFSNEFCKALNRKYISGHFVDVKYIWAREQKIDKNPHYHFVVFCNGNAIQNPFTIFKEAHHYWAKTIGYPSEGLIDYCFRNNGKNHDNGIMIRKDREDHEANIKKAYRAASYLAKIGTKDIRDKYSCSFGSSHVS